jgi:putative (di)nucleoside polyphosphate hydrolase
MASAHFRAGTVAVVRRSDNSVLAFERVDAPGAWQLPQGGLRPHESALDGVWRELGEETSLGSTQVTLVGEHPVWVTYEFPASIRAGRPERIGQSLRWFFFDALDDAIEPRPDGREFRAWAWWRTTELIDQMIDFKRSAYAEVLS